MSRSKRACASLASRRSRPGTIPAQSHSRRSTPPRRPRSSSARLRPGCDRTSIRQRESTMRHTTGARSGTPCRSCRILIRGFGGTAPLVPPYIEIRWNRRTCSAPYIRGHVGLRCAQRQPTIDRLEATDFPCPYSRALKNQPSRLAGRPARFPVGERPARRQGAPCVGELKAGGAKTFWKQMEIPVETVNRRYVSGFIHPSGK